MANISNRLKGLFNDYLNRLEEEKKSPNPYVARNPYYGSCCRPPMSIPHQQRINFGGDEDDFKGVIYFYEWSDIKRSPRLFYTLRAFENFLNSSHIFLASYQKELLINLPTPYVSCRKDGSLIIKCNYEKLSHDLDDINKGSEDKEPYGVAITRPPIQKPKLTYELEGRWDEMHPEVGGCWGW